MSKLKARAIFTNDAECDDINFGFRTLCFIRRRSPYNAPTMVCGA